ncbi:MAG: GNAT family N-acetyltransferase [Dermatophilaceae bacterium]
MDLRLLEHQPTLVGKLVRLAPMGPEHFEGLWPMFADEAGRSLTGTMAEFTREQVRLGLAKARDRHDRADWAIVDAEDGTVLGEVVLFGLDEDNESMVFRIALVGPSVFGHGFGTEATRLVRDFAFEQLGLHRLTLEVFDHNPRARRVYEKCGFIVEGVRRDAQRIDGIWHDAIDMALLDSDPRP